MMKINARKLSVSIYSRSEIALRHKTAELIAFRQDRCQHDSESGAELTVRSEAQPAQHESRDCRDLGGDAIALRMLRAHHEDRADCAGEQCDSDWRIAKVSRDGAEQRDYQKIAHPRARRTVGLRFSRAPDEESDRQREDESQDG